MKVEWRVVLVCPAINDRPKMEIPTRLENEAEAHEYAKLEAADYPHHEVRVEWRTVSEWKVKDHA